MNEHEIMGARELTDGELALIQGGGFIDSVKRAGNWVKDKATDAWNSITSPRAQDNYKSIGAILGIITAVITLGGGSGGTRTDSEEDIH